MAETGWKIVTWAGYTVKRMWREHYFVASHNTYYVSTTGNDANPGTFALPFLTLAHAVSVLVAGDVLYIRGGTYIVQQLNLNKSGNAGAYITICGYPGETVIIKPDIAYSAAFPHAATIVMTAAHYVTLCDLQIQGYKGETGAPTADEDGTACCVLVGGSGSACSFINLIHLVCSQAQHCGIKENGQVNASRINVDECTFFNNGTDSHDHHIYFPCGHNVIRGCLLLPPCPGYGLHLFINDASERPGNNIVYNNIVIGCALGGLVNNGAFGQYYHNVLYKNVGPSQSYGMLLYNVHSHDNIIKNNVFSKNHGYPAGEFDFGCTFLYTTPNTIDYNVTKQTDGRQTYYNSVYWTTYGLPHPGPHEIRLATPTFVQEDETGKVFDFTLDPASAGYGAQDTFTIPASDAYPGVDLPQPMGIFSGLEYSPRLVVGSPMDLAFTGAQGAQSLGTPVSALLSRLLAFTGADGVQASGLWASVVSAAPYFFDFTGADGQQAVGTPIAAIIQVLALAMTGADGAQVSGVWEALASGEGPTLTVTLEGQVSEEILALWQKTAGSIAETLALPGGKLRLRILSDKPLRVIVGFKR